jgi:Asp-tRNA(Asn)/Glu-tRNA(Gln) amidotransferase A subunit family amidase
MPRATDTLNAFCTEGEVVLRGAPSGLLSSAGLAGNQQITLPMAEVGGLPVGLSFIGSS